MTFLFHVIQKDLLNLFDTHFMIHCNQHGGPATLERGGWHSNFLHTKMKNGNKGKKNGFQGRNYLKAVTKVKMYTFSHSRASKI